MTNSTNLQANLENEFSEATERIRTFIDGFGMGDWNDSIRYVTPEDWRSWGNTYPTEGSGAIAVMSYGGVWCDVMNGEAVEIRDRFFAWVEEQGWSYEIQNETTTIIYKRTFEADSPLLIARRNFQTCSSLFERVPSVVNLEELTKAATALMEADQSQAIAP